MKQLILVRHAKSSWSEPGERDFDRPLNGRGERNAPEMAERLKTRGLRPQLIVASGARRALRTAQLMAAVFDYPLRDIEIVDALYEASLGTWLGLVQGLPAHVDIAMMVGHNPEITEVANRLCPGARIDNVPTCGVLSMAFGIGNWGALGGTRPQSWDFDYPKKPASPPH